MIKIVSESSIAAGIRRIEAITGAKVEEAINRTIDTLKEIGTMFNNAPDLVQTLKKSIAENESLKSQVEDYFKERIQNLAKKAIQEAETIGDIKVVKLNGPRVPDIVKNVAFTVRQLSTEGTVFLGATVDLTRKPLLTVMITEDLVKRGFNASQIVREAAKAIKGGGGGQPGFAQAGGKDADGIVAAEKILEEAFK